MHDASLDGHPSENDLVLYHYGELPEQDAAERHLGACAACRDQYDRLESVLTAVDSAPAPVRSEAYGAEVWARLEPHLRADRPSISRGPRRWAMAAAAALMLSAAFLAGRFWRGPDDALVATGAPQAIPAPVRERILLVAVGEHLDRSQMALMELMNASDGAAADGAPVDISGRQKTAEELVSANRLYRQSAAASKDAAVTMVLDELERVLLDVAHGPSLLTHAELQALQRRINERGILFKVRVIGSQVREREKSAAVEPSSGHI